MKTDNTIKEVRESGKKLFKNGNNRIPVIVLTEYSKNKGTYGIQFWTNNMINIGTSVNTDKTISSFIEIL
jgi:hypothetical protein